MYISWYYTHSDVYGSLSSATPYCKPVSKSLFPSFNSQGKDVRIYKNNKNNTQLIFTLNLFNVISRQSE